MKQRVSVEVPICEAYHTKETSHFCLFYFENQVPSLRTRVRQNDDGGPSTNPPSLSVFDHPGRASGKSISRWLDDREIKSITLCVLLNCDEIQPTLRYVLISR